MIDGSTKKLFQQQQRKRKHEETQDLSLLFTPPTKSPKLSTESNDQTNQKKSTKFKIPFLSSKQSNNKTKTTSRNSTTIASRNSTTTSPRNTAINTQRNTTPTTPRNTTPTTSRNTTTTTQRNNADENNNTVDKIKAFLETPERRPKPSQSTETQKRTYTYLTNKLLHHHNLEQHLHEQLEHEKIPTGLQINVPCKLQLTKELFIRWQRTLKDASKTLMELIIEHHKNEIEKIENDREKMKQTLTQEITSQLDDNIIEAFNNNKKRRHSKTNEHNEHI